MWDYVNPYLQTLHRKSQYKCPIPIRAMYVTLTKTLEQIKFIYALKGKNASTSLALNYNLFYLTYYIKPLKPKPIIVLVDFIGLTA